ncbi:MAG: homocysteine S-methyltransferase family protein, partial [Ligilactobacillus agilis]|nr:homocysteine S-methyltransferase family protein [Ligilactobacillus agilis]
MDFKTEITKGPLTLDGAMGTALELQGFDTNTDLWTAKALITDPQKVYRVHYDYFKAGARATITNTYQANVQAFMKKGYDETISREI